MDLDNGTFWKDLEAAEASVATGVYSGTLSVTISQLPRHGQTTRTCPLTSCPLEWMDS